MKASEGKELTEEEKKIQQFVKEKSKCMRPMDPEQIDQAIKSEEINPDDDN